MRFATERASGCARRLPRAGAGGSSVPEGAAWRLPNRPTPQPPDTAAGRCTRAGSRTARRDGRGTGRGSQDWPGPPGGLARAASNDCPPGAPPCGPRPRSVAATSMPGRRSVKHGLAPSHADGEGHRVRPRHVNAGDHFRGLSAVSSGDNSADVGETLRLWVSAMPQAGAWRSVGISGRQLGAPAAAIQGHGVRVRLPSHVNVANAVGRIVGVHRSLLMP
jgi:hypothetical protein